MMEMVAQLAGSPVDSTSSLLSEPLLMGRNDKTSSSDSSTSTDHGETQTDKKSKRLWILVYGFYLMTVVGIITAVLIPSFNSNQHHGRHRSSSPTAGSNSKAAVEFLALDQSIDAAAEEEEEEELTVNFEKSAFTMEQYDFLQEPYASYPCMPKRLHISQHDNVRFVKMPKNESKFHHNETQEGVVSVTVSFMLDYAQCGNVAPPKVYYRQGFQPEQAAVPQEPPLQFNYSSAHTDTIFQSDWIYHVTLPNLKAGPHDYWYRIEVVQAEQEGDGGVLANVGQQTEIVLGTTPSYSFLTPPLPHTPTSIALIGDLGQTQNSTKTMAHIYHATLAATKTNPITMLLIAGDMSYADADPLRWLSWFDLMEPLMRSLNVAVAPGNHEIECDDITRSIFVQYEHYFHNPNRIRAADMTPITEVYRQSLLNASCATPSVFEGHYNYGNSFYSFHHGLVHFIVLNSYTDTRVGSPQYMWLQHELEHEVNREKTPWLIVSFHSPIYTTFDGHVNESPAMRIKASMESLFIQYGVNIVVNGHDHAYMRTKSLGLNATVDSTGSSPIYLTLGAGGNREGHIRAYRSDTTEDWVEKRDRFEYGYGNLLVTNATHATFNWVRDGTTAAGIEDKNVWFVNHHAS